MISARFFLLATALALSLALTLAFAPTAANAYPPRGIEVPRLNYSVSWTAGAGTPRVFPSTNITLALLGDDVVTTQVPIGFPLTFYGRTYTNLTISSNGNLQFEMATISTGGMLSNWYDPYNDDPYWTFIAGFWCDLGSGSRYGGGNITAATVGAAPNRVFVTRYDRINFLSQLGNITFDIELYERTNVIQVRYYVAYAGSYDPYVSVGLSGPVHGDYTIDTQVIANGQNLNATALAQYSNTSVTFTPLPATGPYVSSATLPVRDARGAFRAVVARSMVPLTLPALPNATQLDLSSFGGNPSADSIVATPRPMAPRTSFITLPLNLNFSLYGVVYTNVSLFPVSGQLQFVAAPTRELYAGTTLPINTTNAVQPLLAFALASWYVGAGSTGSVTYATVNDTASGGRAFRLRYNAVPHSDATDQYLTCEVVLYERSSTIEVRYLSMPVLLSQLAIGFQSSRISANATSIDQQYEYSVVIGNSYMSDAVSSYLTNSVVQFTNCTGGVSCTDPPVVQGYSSSSSTGDAAAAGASDAHRASSLSSSFVTVALGLAALLLALL